MSLQEFKITESDKQNKGVISAPDTLTGTAQQNKTVFDKLVGFVADKYNLALDSLDTTINGVNSDLSNRYTKAETDGLLNTKANSTDVYTKSEVYTKDETNTAIDNKILEIGSADMTKAVYDTNSNGIVDNAEKLGNQPPEYYASKQEVENAIKKGISQYTQNGGNLTGEGDNGKFKANTTKTYTQFTVNGVAKNVRAGAETSIDIASGAVYSFIIDGDTINFNSGGGLSNSKLALATAVPSDVALGKTFYAGNKELKTGTKPLSQGVSGTFTSTQNTNYTVSLGFKPSKIMLVYLYSGNVNTTIFFDASNPSKYKLWSGENTGVDYDNKDGSIYGHIVPTANGFTFKGYYANSGNQKIQYIAIL